MKAQCTLAVVLVLYGAACGSSSMPSRECGQLVACSVDASVVPTLPGTNVLDAGSPFDASTGERPPDAADAAPFSFGEGGIASMCPDGQNVLFVQADPGGAGFQGVKSIDAASGTWTGMAAGDWYLDLGVSPKDPTYDDGWTIQLSIEEMRVPFAVQRYDHATTFPGDGLHAGMSVQGGGLGCQTTSGWFEITRLVETPDPATPESPSLQAITLVFEQHCDGRAAALRGCVSFQVQP